MVEPIDNAHSDSMAALEWLRRAFADARRRIALWEPSPSPTAHRPSTTNLVPETATRDRLPANAGHRYTQSDPYDPDSIACACGHEPWMRYELCPINTRTNRRNQP